MADNHGQAPIPSENISRFFSDLEKLLATGLEQQKSLRLEMSGFQSQFTTFENAIQEIREGQADFMDRLATCDAREGHETQTGADVEEGTVSLASRCSAQLLYPDAFYRLRRFFLTICALFKTVALVLTAEYNLTYIMTSQ